MSSTDAGVFQAGKTRKKGLTSVTIKKTMGRLGYAVFLLLSVCIGVEYGARIIPGWSEWTKIIVDPDHRMPPNSAPDLNSDGIRSRRNADEFREEDFNIVFLGDSFTYGLWLGDKQNIPQQFEQIANAIHPGANIKAANFGWVGSSPLLSYRLLKDIGSRYKPDLVIQIIDMTDVSDDLYYDALLNRKNGFEYSAYLPTFTLIAQRLLKYSIDSDRIYQQVFGIPREDFFIIKQPVDESRYAFDFMKQHIDLSYEYAKYQLGAEFIVVVMPRYFQYNPAECPNDWEKLRGDYAVPGTYAMEPFKYFNEMSERSPYPVYSLLDAFKTAKPPTVFDNDAHLNAEGALFAAEALFDYCESIKCIRYDRRASVAR